MAGPADSVGPGLRPVLDLGGQTSIFADLITTDYNLPGTMIMANQPIGVFYGFKSLGVVRDSAQAATIKYKNFSGSTFKPGDMLIANIDGDTIITLNDRTIIGDPTPDFTYGFTNTVDWRGWQLTGLLQGSHGGKILNVNRIRTESSPRANNSKDRWAQSHVPTATWLDFKDVKASDLPQDKDRVLVFYCANEK